MLFKILVYWQTVSNFTDVYPIGNIGHFSNRLAFTLLQEDDVSCDRCSCVILKCTVLAAWQTDSTDKVGFIRKHLSCRFITLIKCSCRGNKCHDSAVFQLVESFCKEEIVQFRCIVDSITETKLTERNIAHSHIKAAVLKTVLLKALNSNIRIRIECLSNSAG